MRSWKFLGSYNLLTGHHHHHHQQQQQLQHHQETSPTSCQITDAYIVASDAELGRQLKENLPPTAKTYDISNGMLKMINNGKQQQPQAPNGDPWYETAEEAMATKSTVVSNYDKLPKINGYSGGAMGTVTFPSVSTSAATTTATATTNGHHINGPQIHRHPTVAPPPIPTSTTQSAAPETFDRLKKYENELRKRRETEEKRIQEQNFLR